MAKRARTKRITTHGIVREIDRHIKTFQKMKKGAAADSRKRMDLHIKNLRKMRTLATCDCDTFALLV